MKILPLILISITVTSCSSSNIDQPKNQNVSQETKKSFNACVNKGVIVKLFATAKASGKNVRLTKEYRVFDDIKEGNATVAKNILSLVESSSYVKPDVLASAFAVHCYAPGIPTPYKMGSRMQNYAACNGFSGNTQALGSCVRKFAGVDK